MMFWGFPQYQSDSYQDTCDFLCYDEPLAAYLYFSKVTLVVCFRNGAFKNLEHYK